MIQTGDRPRDAYRKLMKAWPSKKDDGPYWWTPWGVYSAGRNGATRLTYRPIVPFQRGIDQDGALYANVAWLDWRRVVQTRWIPDEQARDPKALIALPGSPVDSSKGREAGRWMTYALGRIEGEDVRLATRLGWIGDQFVWPGNLGDRIWYGDAMDAQGDVEATKQGILDLCDLGEPGYLPLVALGLSAASPLIRFAGTRNPILGFAQRTSRGKTTALSFALSLWGAPEAASLPGGSTAKGAQDLGTVYPDTPILLEDLHKLQADRPEMVADLLYYLGNGQRRVTSSREQKAKGGEIRRAVAFYASERGILDGAMGGVIFRTWELAGDPMPSRAVALAVAEATQRGRGAAGPLLAAAYTERYAEWRHLLSEEYSFLGETVDTSSLVAGDVSAVRSLAHGLAVLRTALSISPKALDEVAICRWLVDQLAEKRAGQVDSIAVAFEQLVSAVVGGAWGKKTIIPSAIDGEKVHVFDEDVLEINSETIAWRDGWGMGAWDRLTINISATWATRIIYRYGSERSLLQAWRDRGWIVTPPKSKHTKWCIDRGRCSGRIGIRLSSEQLERFTGTADSDEEAIDASTP